MATGPDEVEASLPLNCHPERRAGSAVRLRSKL